MALEGIWFFLWGLLWAIFFMTDGFDLGIGTLYPFLGKTDDEKRMMINAIGPLWDGNEVWLITAGGVTFAAFPKVYAVMFSSLYSPLMIILFALILRGVSFEFRGKVDNPAWRRIWDGSIFVGSAVPTLLFGVVFANIFRGLPINEDGIFHGSLVTLINPYALLGGFLFLSLFTLHGSLWLLIRTEGELQRRALKTAYLLWPLVVVMILVFLAASRFSTGLYGNYQASPILFSFLLVPVIGLIGIRLFIKSHSFFKAWFSSCLTIVGTIFFGIIGLYPNLFPSSLNSEHNLTAYNSASSPMTLKIMLVVVLIFIPAVIGYQIWAYHLFKGKVTKADLSYEEAL
ncbi:MAG: cytochrome d ubiquinol oxidase subunit II [Pseudomonadota bacterium]